jgi:uncharacterized CHY-type Zn-finger protein
MQLEYFSYCETLKLVNKIIKNLIYCRVCNKILSRKEYNKTNLCKKCVEIAENDKKPIMEKK